MAKSTQRKKPGFTKAGEVKIVSLNFKQLNELMAKATKKKVKAKIQRRIHDMVRKNGYDFSAVEVTEAPAAE